jgi:hypothetical protein
MSISANINEAYALIQRFDADTAPSDRVGTARMLLKFHGDHLKPIRSTNLEGRSLAQLQELGNRFFQAHVKEGRAFLLYQHAYGKSNPRDRDDLKTRVQYIYSKQKNQDFFAQLMSAIQRRR